MSPSPRAAPRLPKRFLLLALIWIFGAVLCALFADHRGDQGDRILCVLHAPQIASVGLGYLMGPGHDPSAALFYVGLLMLAGSSVAMVVARSARLFCGLASLHAGLVGASFIGFARYIAYCHALGT